MMVRYWDVMLLVDYARMLLGSALIVILFFGGWLGPTFISAFIWFIAKVSIIALFIIIIRATTVRMRIDKLLRLGWKYLMPLAVINLLLAALILI